MDRAGARIRFALDSGPWRSQRGVLPFFSDLLVRGEPACRGDGSREGLSAETPPGQVPA